MFACYKQSNNRFYPTNHLTGEVIGSARFGAGHDEAEECFKSVASPNSNYACYKGSTGLYYPSQADTAEVIGDDSYQSGHAELEECQNIINEF